MIQQYRNTKPSAEYETPQDLFDALDAIFSFKLDVAASAKNHKCQFYFTLEQPYRDALTCSWIECGDATKRSIWMNPPYDKSIERFVQKAFSYCGYDLPIVALLPARTETRWFHECILQCPDADLYFIRGRLHFNNSKMNAPFPCCIVVWNDYGKHRRDILQLKPWFDGEQDTRTNPRWL